MVAVCLKYSRVRSKIPFKITSAFFIIEWLVAVKEKNVNICQHACSMNRCKFVRFKSRFWSYTTEENLENSRLQPTIISHHRLLLFFSVLMKSRRADTEEQNSSLFLDVHLNVNHIVLYFTITYISDARSLFEDGILVFVSLGVGSGAQFIRNKSDPFADLVSVGFSYVLVSLGKDRKA